MQNLLDNDAKILYSKSNFFHNFGEPESEGQVDNKMQCTHLKKSRFVFYVISVGERSSAKAKFW